MSQLALMGILLALVSAIWVYSRLQQSYWCSLKTDTQLSLREVAEVEIINPAPVHPPEQMPRARADQKAHDVITA